MGTQYLCVKKMGVNVTKLKITIQFTDKTSQIGFIPSKQEYNLKNLNFDKFLFASQ